MKTQYLLFLALSISLSLCVSCATAKKAGQLDPETEEFFSHVRYIITAEETRILLELPPSARPRFIQEFWERRDPTPETEDNEFRIAYYARIEEANRLFRGARPGWLTDRGRAFVLFGPPNERQTNPMGGAPIDPYTDPREIVGTRRVAVGEKATEVWVYYNFYTAIKEPHVVKLVFVDLHGTGDYKLSTDLDELIPGAQHTFISPNIGFTHEFYKEEAERAKLHLKRALFNFSWEFLKAKDETTGGNLSIQVTIPYEKIIFDYATGRSLARLELDIEIQDSAGLVVWKKSDGYKLDFPPGFIDENKDSVWETAVPVETPLARGTYKVYISLKNTDGDQWVEKLLPLKM